jgi:histidine triad (HIT) family protein
MDCVFCRIINREAPALRVRSFLDAIVIVPLGPVVEGHRLVIPRAHVADFTEDPDVSAATMRCAAIYARDIGGDANLITSRGAAATQTIHHLHIHVVPRRAGDGLALPWDPTPPLEPRQERENEWSTNRAANTPGGAS